MTIQVTRFRIKVSVMEMEWSKNMDPETGILLYISRTYSGIVQLEIFLELVPETGRFPEHILESGKILEIVK